METTETRYAVHVKGTYKMRSWVDSANPVSVDGYYPNAKPGYGATKFRSNISDARMWKSKKWAENKLRSVLRARIGLEGEVVEVKVTFKTDEQQ